MTPERKARITHVLNHRQPDLTIVLENVHDPHNVSAVIRTCDAVGVLELYVITTIKPHGKFSRNASAGTAEWLTMHQFDDMDACVAALKQKGYRLFATHLGEESHSLYDLDLTAPTALVFGNEHVGVTKELLAECDGNFIIPQVGMAQSLNISVACAVSLYEAYRQREQKGYHSGEPRLSPDIYKELDEKWNNKRIDKYLQRGR